MADTFFVSTIQLELVELQQFGSDTVFQKKSWTTCKWMSRAAAPYSSTLVWKIPWMEEPGRLQSMGSRRVGHTEWLHFHFSLSCTGEGNGNPLQCSCLENPRDGGAWWAAVYGVTQSRIGLKWLSSKPIKFYLQKQEAGQSSPVGCNLSSPLLASVILGAVESGRWGQAKDVWFET